MSGYFCPVSPYIWSAVIGGFSISLERGPVWEWTGISSRVVTRGPFRAAGGVSGPDGSVGRRPGCGGAARHDRAHRENSPLPPAQIRISAAGRPTQLAAADCPEFQAGRIGAIGLLRASGWRISALSGYSGLQIGGSVVIPAIPESPMAGCDPAPNDDLSGAVRGSVPHLWRAMACRGPSGAAGPLPQRVCARCAAPGARSSTERRRPPSDCWFPERMAGRTSASGIFQPAFEQLLTRYGAPQHKDGVKNIRPAVGRGKTMFLRVEIVC